MNTIKDKKVTIKDEEAKEKEENKEKLARFIEDNPGTTIGEIRDNCNCDFGDDCDFLEMMVALLNEYGICADDGQYFFDWETREDAR